MEQKNIIASNETNALAIQIKKSGLEAETEKSLSDNFLPFYAQALEWKEKAETLIVTDASQKSLMLQAREARIILKNIRTSVEKTRVILKEDSKRKGQAIDNVARILKNLIEPIEEHLEKQERFIEIQEATRKEILRNERIEKLKEFEVEPSFYDLANMPNEQFDLLLESSKTNYLNKKDAEKHAEEERIEKERRDNLHKERKESVLHLWAFTSEFEKTLDFGEVSETDFNNFVERLNKAKIDYDKKQEELKVENERLKKEAEEKEAKIKEERRIFEENEKKDREKIASRCRELSDLGMRFNGQEYYFEDVNVHVTEMSPLINDLEWLGLLSKIKPVIEERKKAQELAYQKEISRQKEEAIMAAKKEAEEKAVKEAEIERKSQLAAQRKEKLRPDKEKLLNFALQLTKVAYPELKSDEAKEIMRSIMDKIVSLIKYIEQNSEKL